MGCAEAARYIVRRPDLPGCSAHGDELTYVSLGEGACSEGEFWESLNTACTLHLPVLYVVADNGYAISVPAVDQHPAPVIEMVRGFRGLRTARVDGTDYLAVRRVARDMVEHVRAGVGPGLIHADVVRPYSHSAADTQSKYRPADELTEEATHDPIDRLEAELVDAGILTERRGRRHPHRGRRGGGQGIGRGHGRRPARPRSDHHPGVGPAGHPRCRRRTRAGDGPPVTMGDAIRRTLHEQMAADERIRVFGEDVADAREAVLARVEGQGRRVRHDARAPARVRAGPLLQHAAVGGQHRRSGRRARACGGCARRPRSSSSTTSGRP